MNVIVRVTLDGEGYLDRDSTFTVIIDGLPEQPRRVVDAEPSWPARLAATVGRLPWGLLLDVLARLRWTHSLVLTEGQPHTGQILEIPVSR